MFRQKSEEIRRREIPFGGQTGQPPAALHAAVLQMDFDHVLFQEPKLSRNGSPPMLTV